MGDTMAATAEVRRNPYGKPVEGIIPPELSPPFLSNVVYGLQHVFAMFGATVLGPLLMGFDPNTAIFFSGIATLLFYVIVGGRVPSYLGSSFAFIAAVVAATGYSGIGPNPALPVALGGIIAAGAVYALVGAIIWFTGTGWVGKVFPPTVTGAIVAVIGLNLAGVGVGQIGDSPIAAAIGVGVVLLVAVATIYFPAFLRRIPILIGGLAGYGAYYYLANVLGKAAPIDFAPVLDAAWIGMPTFTAPVFEPTAIVLIAPVALILVAENFGHIKAIGAMTNRNLDPYMGRSFFADGVATMLAGFGGGTGVTTYAENMGVMRITRNFSSMTLVIAGVVAIGLGLSPKFGAMISTIPQPVLGGLSFVMFGLITATAGAIWQAGRAKDEVDFDETRTLIVVGVALVIGAGDLSIRIGAFEMGGIVTATLAAIVLHHLLGYRRRPPKGEEDGASPYNS